VDAEGKLQVADEVDDDVFDEQWLHVKGEASILQQNRPIELSEFRSFGVSELKPGAHVVILGRTIRP
jgi:hypothetical protein